MLAIVQLVKVDWHYIGRSADTQPCWQSCDDNKADHSLIRGWNNNRHIFCIVGNINISHADVELKYRFEFIGLRYSDCNKIQNVSILAPEILSDDNFNKMKLFFKWFTHYTDVIMGAMASQITSLTIVYSTVYSGADQRKHQSSASLAFVRGIHRARTSEFPAQTASNAENASIWWRHHEKQTP